MAEKMTEDELKTRIDAELRNSLGYFSDELSKQREMAMEYYYALPFGNEIEGRSQFVASGDEMVKFNPVGPEDVAMAEQATDYVNHVFVKDNNGWEILYSWFTDALLQKNGIIKVWWDEYPESKREEYHRLSNIEVESMLSSPDVEVTEHTEYLEGEETFNDIVIIRSDYNGRVKIENVPPSEFLIARESKSIQDAKFVCHRVQVTLSDLREMYPDENLEPEDLGGGDDDMEDIEDTLTILGKYVDGLEIQGKKKPLNELMTSLYHEALEEHNFL